MRLAIDAYQVYAPTDTAAKRWEQMMDECIANLPAGALGGLTQWEAGLSRLGRAALESCSGRLVDAYGCSGGLLSVFADRPSEEEDDVWRELAGRPDGDVVWNDTPSPLFANLTPAEVWAGGGAEELRLASEFMTMFAFAARRKRGSQAELVHHALLSLRDWQRRSTNGATPAQIILDERRKILARKRRYVALLLDGVAGMAMSTRG